MHSVHKNRCVLDYCVSHFINSTVRLVTKPSSHGSWWAQRNPLGSLVVDCALERIDLNTRFHGGEIVHIRTEHLAPWRRARYVMDDLIPRSRQMPTFAC